MAPVSSAKMSGSFFPWQILGVKEAIQQDLMILEDVLLGKIYVALLQGSIDHEMGVSKNQWYLYPKMDGLYIMENLIRMDDLGGVPLFLETYKCSH